ncbi:hypothetical protein BDV27DRAFT_160801 [Aspergillus caelatus]|uniref:Uncharacterized protein n=1 Tax=Aspergillus caelatus TaxID=61420 RepID=A0A5N6ZVA2_9EURO|nr:uncharacterized protein BDV27DRAFT_160801 [Aspergillus caelatus]KAE8361335.1 hypothetical protein BDV27DRAFT_160801 [Aspergillus caelatus]
MIPAVLVSALFFTARAYSVEVDRVDRVAADQIISQLESNIKLDSKNKPYNQAEKYWEPTCIEQWGGCNNIGKYRRTYLESADTISVTYEVSLEESMINADPVANKLVLRNSTWITQSSTKGWTIGAKLSGTVGKEGKGSVGGEISAQYSDSNTNEKKETREVSYEMTCQPHHECRFETWTFHVKATGLCQWFPMLDCAGEVAVCDTWPWNENTCQQFLDVRDQCPAKANRPQELCEVITPLYEAGGKPFSKVVTVSIPLNGTKRSELGPEYQVIL